MLFNSYIFILAFFPVCWGGYYFLNHFIGNRIGLLWLLLMSGVFYGWSSKKYLLILLGSILINYGFFILQRKLKYKKNNRKLSKFIFIISILANLLILGYFKYYNFLGNELGRIFPIEMHVGNIILPLGISFYTFQQISFVVDSYTKSENNDMFSYRLYEYALYVLLFPQLVAGPIVKHSDIIPQFRDGDRKKINGDLLAKGLMLFSIGLAKKILIADVFGKVVDVLYTDISSLTTVTAIIAALSYTIQIYFDFSGYSDMAMGLGWMLNLELPVNFESPYKAFSLTEFWKRWHISLTNFFREYVYIPLGGNRSGKFKTIMNTIIVFLLSGFWHGAGYAYILWGGAHGVGLAFERVMGRIWKRLHPVFTWCCMFIYVSGLWIFFRLNDLSKSISVIYKILQMKIERPPASVGELFISTEWKAVIAGHVNLMSELPNFIMLFYFIVVFIIMLVLPNARQLVNKMYRKWYSPLITAFLLVWCIYSFTGVSIYLYYNF